MTCPYCSGMVGRDCFNVEECGEITRQMALQSTQDTCELDGLRADLAAVERERDEARAANDAVKVERDIWQRKAHDRRERIVELESEIERLRAEDERLRELLANMTENGQILAVAGRISELERERDEARALLHDYVDCYAGTSCDEGCKCITCRTYGFLARIDTKGKS